MTIQIATQTFSPRPPTLGARGLLSYTGIEAYSVIMRDNIRITPTINSSTVLRALGIFPGEGVATGLFFGQFAFMGVGLFSLYTSSSAIFLSSFDADAIPYVFVVSALLLTLSGTFFNRLERRFPLAPYCLEPWVRSRCCFCCYVPASGSARSISSPF